MGNGQVGEVLGAIGQVGGRKVKLHYCDNCGRRHWGYYYRDGSWEFPDEWSFQWTTRKGVKKVGTPC